MGLTDRQKRNIVNYRDKGGKFYSKNDLAKLYTISEEDFSQLEPYIVLPEVSRKDYTKSKTETKEYQNHDPIPLSIKDAFNTEINTFYCFSIIIHWVIITKKSI